MLNFPKEFEVAKQNNKIADSDELRLNLMQKVHSKEITLNDAQEELKKIKKLAHNNGLYIRNDFYKKVLFNLDEHIEKNRVKALNKLNTKLEKKLNSKKDVKENKTKI